VAISEDCFMLNPFFRTAMALLSFRRHSWVSVRQQSLAETSDGARQPAGSEEPTSIGEAENRAPRLREPPSRTETLEGSSDGRDPVRAPWPPAQVSLEQAADAYARMMQDKARFRMVLVTKEGAA
jgi:hypothetical protein